MTFRRLLTLVLALAMTPGALSAQSLLNAAGIGVPSDPLDARSRALGGVPVGLRGAALLGTDPAAAARFGLPAVTMTAQPTWVDFGRADNEESGTFRGTRFPSLGIVYPAGRLGMVSISLESVFDQRYHAERPVSLDLGEGPVGATDQFVSEGGVSQVRIGVARIVGDNVGLGVSAGRYTGSLARRLRRNLDEAPDDGSFVPYESGGEWGYSGTTVTGGANVSLGTFAQIGGSVTWSGSLDATAADESVDENRSFDIPLQLRVGASVVLAPGLFVTGGFSTADWSSIDKDLAEGSSVGSASTFGGGVELSRASVFGRSAPLRFGYRHADLPFGFGSGAPTETAWTGGFGLILDQIGELVRASMDIAVERGERADQVITERFWRATLTLRVAGF